MQPQWAVGMVVATLCAACTGPARQSEESADLIVRNAKVLTVDSEFSRAEAVAVRDGVFTTSFHRRDPGVGPRAGERDAGGKLDSNSAC